MERPNHLGLCPLPAQKGKGMDRINKIQSFPVVVRPGRKNLKVEFRFLLFPVNHT